jgi:hypothetical protein
MLEIKEINYKSILDNHFANGDIVVCAVVANPNCFSCITNGKNINNFRLQYPKNNIHFYFVDYVKSNILQNYSEFSQISAYPKIIIFDGSWDKKEFLGGVIPVNKLEQLFKSSVRYNID